MRFRLNSKYLLLRFLPCPPSFANPFRLCWRWKGRWIARCDCVEMREAKPPNSETRGIVESLKIALRYRTARLSPVYVSPRRAELSLMLLRQLLHREHGNGSVASFFVRRPSPQAAQLLLPVF